MKHLGAIIIGGLTVLVALTVGVYLLRPADTSPQTTFVINVEADLAPIEAELSSREAGLQAELDALNRSLQQKQSRFDSQVEARETEMNQLRLQLDNLKSTETSLQATVAQLEITHTLKLGEHQTQAGIIRQTYQQEIDQLQTELDDKEARLTALTAQPER